MYSLDTLPWNNRFSRLSKTFYAEVKPTTLKNAHWVSFNANAAQLINLNPTELNNPDFLDFCSGAAIPTACQPLAMLYSGHQFGHYVSQLGDGRAIMLGETQGWELQLKGSGETPFSRSADGRAVLRSTIREYLCSEAMHHLGIPTTRALAMVNSEEEVCRERIETGAMLLRMAPSHIRFGSFEIFFHRRQLDALHQLAEFVKEHYYPEVLAADKPNLALLKTIIQRTAKLMAQWQLVGFAHGVMNTDNMSILGLTLDYGPFGFLDRYDPHFICNHSDHAGRYAFDQQPAIGLWNLNCLAHAMLPLLSADPDSAVEYAKSALQTYQTTYETAWLDGCREKLGLYQYDTDTDIDADDTALMKTLLEILHKNQVDYTRFFRALSGLKTADTRNDTAIRDLFLERNDFDNWVIQYRGRLGHETLNDTQRQTRMNQVNPKYILRNYMAETAIQQAEQGDYTEVERLLKLLQQPYDEQTNNEHYAAEPPQWAQEISVSCSS